MVAGGTDWWQEGEGAGGGCSSRCRSERKRGGGRRRENLKVESKGSFSGWENCEPGSVWMVRDPGGGAALLGEVHGEWEEAGSRAAREGLGKSCSRASGRAPLPRATTPAPHNCKHPEACTGQHSYPPSPAHSYFAGDGVFRDGTSSIPHLLAAPGTARKPAA